MREVKVGDYWQWTPNGEIYLVTGYINATSCHGKEIKSNNPFSSLTIPNKDNHNWKYLGNIDNKNIIKVLYGRNS